MVSFKNGLAGLVLAAASAAPAQGALVEHQNIDNTSLQSVVTLDERYRNNDIGAVYNHLELNHLHSLGEQMFALPQNQSYTSVDMLMSNWGYIPRNSGFGSVHNGWWASGSDPVKIEHVPGIPGLSWTIFDYTKFMDFTVTVPKSQLTMSGNASDFGTDQPYWTIELGPHMENAVVAKSADLFSQWPASAYTYTLIPHNMPLPLVGDANIDGVVDDIDLSIVQQNLGQYVSGTLSTNGVPAGWTQGDFTGDGQVTLYDAYLLFKNYEHNNQQQPIPEPASALLFGALAGAYLMGRKRT